MIEEDLTANKLARCEAFSVLVDICRHLRERQPFLSSHQNSQIYVSALMRPFVAEKLDVSVAVPPSFLGRKRGTRAVAGAVAFDGGGSRQRGTDSRFLWVSFLFFCSIRSTRVVGRSGDDLTSFLPGQHLFLRPFFSPSSRRSTSSAPSPQSTSGSPTEIYKYNRQ